MRWARVAVLAIIGGCAGPKPADDREPTPPPPVAAPEVSPPPAVAKPVQAEPPAAPKLGRDHRSVVPCTSNADCDWDHPCFATRCVEASASAVKCDESAPPPGECLCLAAACTTKPKTIPAPTGTCEIRACMVDRAAGKCVADDGGVAEGIRSTPGVDVGPSCDCLNPAKGCTLSWFDAVPCTDDRDCWVSPSPRRHPVARPKALRKRDFLPCADGEVAPKCGPAGQCVLGPAFTC